MTGWENEDPNNFLRILETTSVARRWCRKFIWQVMNEKNAVSVLEVGCGGLNERRGLASLFGMKYVGTDATWKFVENGIKQFPNDDWLHVDVNNLTTKVYDQFDVVYSQHVLEHCGGIGVPLANMLKCAKKHVLNIFFMNPTDGPEQINWTQYPRYHNTYSKEHIGAICEANGFYHEFRTFSNAEFPNSLRTEKDPPIPATETVLIATRKNQ